MIFSRNIHNNKYTGFIILILSLLTSPLCGQNVPISGKVIDNVSGKPLAFVNISYNDSGKGTTTDVNGEFSIHSLNEIYKLRFTYVGYSPVNMNFDTTQVKSGLTIGMNPQLYDIDEVKIMPGINPAHRIIDLVYKFRDFNNPKNIRSFSYNSYNKLFITADVPNITEDTIADFKKPSIDSSLLAIKELTDTQHLFLMESVSARDFIYPDKNYEEIMASRVSGFQDPSFSLLATQLQSFSFYPDFITILNKEYLNPISKGSKQKYLFILEDTLYTEQNDTLFVISFQAKKGKHFESLKGFMHINSNRYAIQDVVAETEEPEDIFQIKIQQKYEFVDNQQWFPIQLNTDIIISNFNKQENKNRSINLQGVGKSYITDVLLYPDLHLEKFSSIEINVDKDAHKQTEEYWEQYRNKPLTAKDTTTYQVVDSIGKEANFDRMLKMSKTLINGYIPISFFNLDIASVIDYNSYEGLRLGIGGITNEKLSNKIYLGGHFAYGFKDKAFKYGANIKWMVSRKLDMDIRASYLDDVKEPASYQFYEIARVFNTDYFRKFLYEQMDIVQEAEVSYGFRFLQYVRPRLFINHSYIIYADDYLFMISDGQPQVYINQGSFTEIGIRLRFAYKEKFLQSFDEKLSLGTNYPIVYANIIQGVNWLNGDFKYTKLEARISKVFQTRSIGKSRFTIDGGLVNGIVPYTKLYNGRGSYKPFTIETDNSFGTMRLNEFISDRFISLFFKQDFGKLLLKIGRFQPDIIFVTNFGIGSLLNPEYHKNIQFKTLEKGYYESGILINNMLNQLFIGYGLGVYYRYGPYTLDKTIDNFAFKFTINFKI